MSVNFQWVSEKLVNKFFNAESLKARKLEKKLAKGYLFERSILQYFNQEIPKNKTLPSGTCEVTRNTLAYQEHKNEEIDLVFRLGSSFLIVEAKALTFGTDCQEFQNIRNRLIDSKIKRKRQAFIDEFEEFRSRHLVNWRGELDHHKVHMCYLVSVPQMVGSSIGGIPVVDMHILERYFLMGGIDIATIDSPDYINCAFYRNLEEAEKFLPKYLLSPPQLNNMAEQYDDTAIWKTQWVYAGKRIHVKEGVIKQSKEAIERHAKSFINDNAL